MDSAIEALDFETEPAQKLFRRGSERLALDSRRFAGCLTTNRL
jgi:hypothetical protein